MKKDDQCQDEWNFSATPRRIQAKEKPEHTSQFSDIETMKEKFAKLLLGEDITGGTKGISTALALSNAINNLAGRAFRYLNFPCANLLKVLVDLQLLFLVNFGS